MKNFELLIKEPAERTSPCKSNLALGGKVNKCNINGGGENNLSNLQNLLVWLLLLNTHGVYVRTATD